MYEDSWYSFVPELQQHQQHQQRPSATGPGPKRKESLLQQNVGVGSNAEAAEQVPGPEEAVVDSPPESTIARRAKSYAHLDETVKAQLAKEGGDARQNRKNGAKARGWEALALDTASSPDEEGLIDMTGLSMEDAILEASQRQYSLYHDQLSLTERHLERLIGDTDSALQLVESLSESFRSVDEQTSSFRTQCNDLLAEQERLQTLTDRVGNDLYHYAYLDTVTRRLNGPGASRLIEDGTFGHILTSLDSCIAFMAKNVSVGEQTTIPLAASDRQKVSYRDAESYLARYQSLLIKALHLLEVGFNAHLDKVSSDISKQIAATQSDSSRYALAYGRFEEMVMSSYSLIPNLQTVILRAYDQHGAYRESAGADTYANTAISLFHSYWNVRERILKPILQHESDSLKAEVTSSSVETAARLVVKQGFERSWNEAQLFNKIMAVDVQYSTESKSAFMELKSHQQSLVNGVNIVPIAIQLQTTFVGSELRTICNVTGWIMNEYLTLEYEEIEDRVGRHNRGLAARLLAEHLWAFTDAAFEFEVDHSISMLNVPAEALQIGPVTDGLASSNAFSPIKRALHLLAMYDQAMPKERCQGNNRVVYKIIKESLSALRRAEARIKSSRTETDAHLFMIKNLLLLKNELVSLEMGEVRSQTAKMQHLGQWNTDFNPQNLMGLLSTLTSYIPGASLFSRGTSPAPMPNSTVAAPGHQDASEELDELLRQSIVAFTQRWAERRNEARARKGSTMESELDAMLERAFGNQPEVVAKLKEAIQMKAQSLLAAERKGSRLGRV